MLAFEYQNKPHHIVICLCLTLATTAVTSAECSAQNSAIVRIDTRVSRANTTRDVTHPGQFMRLRTEYFTRGRRLRIEEYDADGERVLLFFTSHDPEGREEFAVYFEEDEALPSFERFLHDDAARQRTIEYINAQGEVIARTLEDLDERSRPVRKRYYRVSDGEQWGDDDVWYDQHGNNTGWFFRRLDGTDSARFDYVTRKTATGWGPAQKLSGIPYAWSASVTRDGASLYFTNGDDIFTVPVNVLDTLPDFGAPR